METSRFRWFVATENRRSLILIIVWGVAIGSVYSQALFQRTTASALDDAIVLAICFAAGAATQDIGRALFSYIAAMIIGLTIPFMLSIVPALNGTIPPPGDTFFVGLWFGILFKLIFPVQMVLLFAASIVGAIVGEYYL